LANIHAYYPLPNIQDFSNRLASCTIFSTINLVKGNRQVPMDAQDVLKMPFGLFEYLFMPFGLRNTVQMFQCLMDKLYLVVQVPALPL
jgi:hypothetical protein